VLKSHNPDIVIIAGLSSVGKSITSKALVEMARKQGVSCDEVPFAWYTTLREKIINDDKKAGKNHSHPWCVENDIESIAGHVHLNGRLTPIEPFIAIGNIIRDQVFQDWCNRLIGLPTQDNHLWITDMPGGKNIYQDSTIFSSVDSSFRRKCEMLRTDHFPNSWLKRVRFVINPTMDDKVRDSLFKERNRIALGNPACDEITWLKPYETLQIYGEDDFFELKNLLLGVGLSANFIVSIENDGGHAYFKKLQKIIETHIQQFRLEGL
jgi:hypothetical protein